MKSALDRLIEELEAGTWTVEQVRPGDWPQRSIEPQEVLRRSSPSSPSGVWPPASLDAERRFGQPHARLFELVGGKVRTPEGPGTLLQVFSDRATVLLDSELSKCSFFAPSEIEPVAQGF